MTEMKQLAKRVKELEKENALLKDRNEGFEQQILGLLIKYEEVYKWFPDLKSAMDKAQTILKENAGLKERLELLNLNVNIAVRDLNDLLTKAKEHIRTLISCLIDWVQEGDKDYCYIADAEQFLKETEK